MSPRRTTEDALNLGSGNADVMMLYQAIKEARACEGQVDLAFPHPDKPLRFMFEWTARRLVLWGGAVYAEAGQLVTLILPFSLARTNPEPPGARATFYDIGDARERLRELGLDEALTERVLARLGWPQ